MSSESKKLLQKFYIYNIILNNIIYIKFNTRIITRYISKIIIIIIILLKATRERINKLVIRAHSSFAWIAMLDIAGKL